MKRIACRRFFRVIEQMVLVVQNLPANAGDIRTNSSQYSVITYMEKNLKVCGYIDR